MSGPGLLKRVLDARISRLKGSDYRLDPALPATALVGLAAQRVLMRAREIGRAHV